MAQKLVTEADSLFQEIRDEINHQQQNQVGYIQVQVLFPVDFKASVTSNVYPILK